MNHKKHRSFKIGIIALFLALCGATSFAVPQPVSAHHAGECSDVFTPLSSFVVNGVNANRAAYETIMNETGVPWEMLAAIHYRETSFSRTNPSNGQGIFQFVNGEGGPYPPGPVSEGEFRRQLRFMADRLQDDYVWRGSVPRERRRLQPNEQNIVLVKDTLFSYNGRAGVYASQASHFGYNASLQPYEGSPYVMNRFDCSRARMGLITRDFGSMDGIDARYGAFTVFARLRGDNYWRSLSSSPFGNGFVRVKSDDPDDLRQWVLYGTIKQHIPDSQTIFAWGLENTTLVETSTSAINSMSTGPPLDRFARLNTNPGTLYFVDGGKKYAVTNAAYDAWNFINPITSSVSEGLFNLPGNGGYLPYAVKNPGNSTIYTVDGGNGSNQTVLRPYQNTNVFKAWEGDNATPLAISSDYFDKIDNAIGATLTHTKIAHGGNEYQAVAGRRLNQPASIAPLYPGVAQSVSAETYRRLSPFATALYLVKAKGSPNVYLIDNGQKHHILRPDLLSAWAVPNAGYHTLDNAYVDLIPTGDPINYYLADTGSQLYIMDSRKTSVPGSLDTAYRNATGVFEASDALMSLFPSAGSQATGFIKGKRSPQVYLLDNSGNRRHIEWPDKLAMWGSSNPAVTVVSDQIVNTIDTANSSKLFVSDGTTEYVMENGQKVTIPAGVKSEWGLSNPLIFNDGTLDRFTTGGALSNELRDNNIYVLVRGAKAFATADANIADIWGIADAPAHSAKLAANLLSVNMLTRFVRSTADDRTFVVDDGEWYNLGRGPRNNLGGPNEPTMRLDPANAPNSITDWTSFVVQNNAGTHYVIDGGRKRTFPHPIIQNHWTGGGTLEVPTVTDGFLNILPTVGIVERVVKGSAPMVYSAGNGTKRHILYPETYNKFYAPFGIVSDQLLNTMPNGSPIR